jgi:tRNA1Val (adenine37-N6)-methyltransferase
LASAYFDFKKFRVWHNQVAMKVGTDAVVLGCLAPLLPQTKAILDIGTGSGVISLLLAQRCVDACITALEIDELAAQQAQFNFENSMYAARLNCVPTSLQKFGNHTKEKFDLIVSNPPFFEQGKNITIANNARSMARQDVSLSFSDLAKYSALLLNQSGSFCLILPIQEAHVFATEAVHHGLHVTHEIAIIPRVGKPANRLVQVYQFDKGNLVQTELTLKDENANPSEAYIQLSKDFYLRIDQ